MRRLALGLTLIAAASGVLLYSDLPRRRGATPDASIAKKWRVSLIELNNILDVEESEHGVLEGLREAGLVRDRDYEVTIRNAQGDMGVLNGLVDASLAHGADLLIPLSTPALQAAIQRTQGKVPIVFTYVASPIKAGAARTNEDHLPSVTGVSMVGAFEEMLALLKRVVPSVKRVGTLFVPAEVNMVFNRDQLIKAAEKAGIEVVAVGVATSTEVPDAAQALVSKGIDVVCQLPGSLTAAAFGGIAQAANRAKVPVFAFQQAQLKEGASVVLARDYYDAGRQAAAIAARVMRGESPAGIPIQPYTKTKLFINQAAARRCGLVIPAELMAQAARVISD